MDATMAPANSPLQTLPAYPLQEFSQLRTDLLATAQAWRVDEVGAAIAHQLNEPLTALLLYLHEIKETEARSARLEVAPDSMRETVERALRETERVCDIIGRIGFIIEAPVGTENAVARGRQAIDSLTANDRQGSPAPALSIHRLLTPREHEVLALITGGASNKEGGYRLGITTRTFEVHRAHIMKKLGARNAADLVRMALTEKPCPRPCPDRAADGCTARERQMLSILISRET